MMRTVSSSWARRVALSVAVAGCTAVVLGCGGTSATTAANGTPTVPVSVFRVSADAVCRETAAALERRSMMRGELTDVLARTNKRTAEGLARLRAIAAPPALRSAYGELLAILAARQRLAEAVEREDLRRMGKALVRMKAQEAKASAIAERLGLDACRNR